MYHFRLLTLFDEWSLILYFLTVYNNGGATLTRLMPGKPDVDRLSGLRLH